jgi:Domain of unknown function (DUF4296)
MKKFIVFVLSLAIFSCSNKPKDLIPHKEMGLVLAEIQLAEAYAATCFVADTAKEKLTNSTGKNLDTLKLYVAKVFAKHKITEAQYKSTLKYYQSKPADLDSIFAIALDTTAKMQNALQAKK